MKRYWTILLAIPFLLATAAMVPTAVQDPEALATEEVKARIRMAELHYVTQNGETKIVPATNMLQMRMLTDAQTLRLEIYYENGDYSLIEPQGFHIIRKGSGAQEVDLIRTTRSGMLFPVVP